ncbi:mucin-5AC isoform X2 [Thunnus maccoyii]|uniref:mucin-5AC isoform X2 n=1 Tax=Thunnus maccoyii TaxID=8240 RepID=UPI001C4B2A0B|nr:mucin-5AC isoform X2 [Thunnus maccoyii]
MILLRKCTNNLQLQPSCQERGMMGNGAVLLCVHVVLYSVQPALSTQTSTYSPDSCHSPVKRVVTSPRLPADEDMTQSAGQTINQLGAQSHHTGIQDQRQSRMTTVGWELQQPAGNSLQLEFQDSNLSPALSLLPINSGVGHNLTEYSLLQQSDMEFAPLRAYPDISMASERFHFPPQDCTTQASDRGSLSQHPLAQATILSEEGASSICSLSRLSLSPQDEGRREEMVHSPRINTVNDRQGISLRDYAGSKEKNSVTLTDPPDKPVGEAPEDETFFLRKDVPAQQLLDLLQRDVGMPSNSSSAVSSTSETSVRSAASFGRESKSTKDSKTSIDHSTVRREGPPGEASLPQQQTQKLDQSRTRPSEVCNITMGSRSTQPDDSSEVLHRELLSQTERGNSREAQSKSQQLKSATPPGEPLTPYPTETSEGKPSVTRTNLGSVPWTGAFSTGVERGYRAQDLWSSGNQTGIDGSYLGFLPQSQSTPGVFKVPPKSSVKATLGHLSAIESNKESSYQSSTGVSSQPAVPVADTPCPNTADQCQDETTSAKVHSLPSLNYMQKVDAWRENQSSGKTSLFDSLALQGFSGVSPKKKAYDAVSDTLNHILSQQARSLHQPPVSSAANQSFAHSSSTAQSGSSSPRRGEAVGSAPSDRDNTGSAARPSASPFGRSQSHSSVNTVVMSVKKDQQTERTAGKKSQTQDNVHQQPSATGQPSPLANLGQFSDVSFDADVMLSSSQDSYNSGIKLGTSIGASSVVSLEVDNYVPYWTSKLSTTPPLPKPRELNIEERIPLYLHNLGIDQSPSTILTPFMPRGPIREPEFSPTDLCTIKGSIGTPTKSTQPSEVGSPLKGEFSRCSILSVDSSISLPFSLDSLGPAVSVPEKTRPSSSSDTATNQSDRRLAPCSQSDEDSVSSSLQTSQQQQRDSSLTSSQNTIQLGDRFDSDLSLATKARCVDRDLESPLQASRDIEQSAEDSFVGTKTLREIRKLLSQAENVVSAGSSVASSAPAVPRLLSDDDIFLSLRKQTGRLQNSLFTSSTAGELRTQSPLLWARSSSDSMLTSEKPRENSIGRESMTSLGQPGYPPTKAVVTASGAGTYVMPQNSSGGGAGSFLVLSKSARRAEPEGCSAAPPDNAVPPQPPVMKPSPAVSTQPSSSTPVDTASTPEEEKQATQGDPVVSISSSPILEDTDQGVISDGSSESSLAVRVAKLLQNESPATMVSSTPSVTDQEESRAREWIKLKISGQQCEPLELDKEDRKRIEEIKRELLLKNPLKSEGSTDTESSAASSVRGLKGQELPRAAETFATLSDAKNQASQQLQCLSTIPPDSSVQLQEPLPNDLEARVREIAAREGVTLPRTNAQALTSITIATRRRSTSPSSSASPVPPLSPAPEPLHLNELSTETVEHPADRKFPPTLDEADKSTRVPASVFEPSGSLYTRKQNLIPQSAPGNQRRQDAVGGQYEEPPPSSQGLDREDVNVREDNTPSFKQDDELSIQDSSVSGVGAEQATVSPTVESQARTGHISHVHLTLSPKTTDHSVATAVSSSHANNAGPGLPRKEFVPLRHSSSATTSPDEGVGLCSPPEWYEIREPTGTRRPERADTSTLFKPVESHRRMTSTSTQSFMARHRDEASPVSLTTETPVPVLLPYKPRGSEELFYVPQTEADVSCTDPSDTTMESSHTGSDDALPPHFSSEVLGHQDPGLDRGVTIRHTEGIYSKRLKTATFKMQEPRHRDGSSQTSMTGAPEPSSHVSVASTRVPLSSNQVTSSTKRDQGTSPVQFQFHYNHPETSGEAFQAAHVELDHSKMSRHRGQRSVPQTEAARDQERRDPDLRQQSSSTLDQLWHSFCEWRSVEESRPTSDREASLLERLERLSRLIHSTRVTNMSGLQMEAYRHPEQTQGWRGEEATLTRKEKRQEVKRGLHGEAREMEGKASRNVPHQVWTHRRQEEETSQPAEEDSSASFTSSYSQSQHLCPADRDESETLSTMSGSMSTVDTARLIRAFGAHRVQHLKMSSGLSKLYSTINKQKEGREQRRGRHKNPPHVITLTNGTDESTVAADSSSSTSTYTFPSHHGPSRSLPAKKTIKLVSKGIQAGDLEIISNGTRRHTRDVGTTFPSPGEARTLRQISSSSSSAERGRRGQRSTSKTPGSQKQTKTKRSPSKLYPEGVSWFISADDVRADARKENRPEEEESAWRPSTAWFEPHNRIYPWREPLRQRQVDEDRNKPPAFTHQTESDPDPASKITSSGLTGITLQEALKMRRPEFISRSKQRVKCLTLQVEERKLQTVFSRERDELFNWPGAQERLPKPAGTALIRRAVPRKEMIQRSKQIYENLPEVQRRKEEERRKAEYQTYRLNAQLYNKRITNRVLGRRTAWH